ncbi:hypothetical protein XA68_12995 [Ophiocordyceps unilateralis]|uniref:Uncharacterized protein n=1 Tax=Ophiocordyceps unilateralis TaxID=268505 RepID=A0A2A9PM51_OPHUN|nr:hypothetical protein XA68_12995 [Ophiocordyceps unilateralis]
MAQSGVPDTLTGAAPAAPCKLSEKEAYEMQQLELIVHFRDTIISGSHSSLKSPKDQSRREGLYPPHSTDARGQGSHGDDATTSPVISKPARTESNAPLLETSDDVRTQVTTRRRALEQVLRDEMEQRRFVKSSQSSLYSTLDISDVLAKAVALVPDTTAPPPFETPQSQMASRVRTQSDEPRGSAAVPGQPERVPRTVDETAQAAAATVAGSADPVRQRVHKPDLPAVPTAAATTAVPSAVVVPGLNNYLQEGNTSTQPGRHTVSGEQSQSDDLVMLNPLPSGAAATSGRSQPLSNSYIDSHPPSPLLRGRPLQQPVAPPTVQNSPLPVSGRGRGMTNLGVQRSRAAPAQIAALRLEPSTATSPESSSQGGRGSDKKKNKKKKRKADRQAPGMEANPFIKIEPRSSSPLAGPSYIRANKRQRQSRGQVPEAEYEPTYSRSHVRGPVDQHLSRPYRDQHAPLGYDGGRAYPQRAVSAAVIGGPGYGREYVDDRGLPVDSQARGHGLLGPAPPYPAPPYPAPPYPYSPMLAYPPRPVSHSFATDGFREPPRPYRELTEGGRLSARPEGDPYAGQPKAAPPRILVDAYGREYFDSSHPPVGPGEPSVLYERIPPRAVSRHPGPESYGDAGLVYGGAPATYAVPRRIVTQPIEYAPYEYRDGQQREYPTRAMAPAGDMVEMGATTERRSMADAPREYPVGATSMMPAETLRYEVPQAYGRVQSVRPEMPGHAPAVHSDGRREAMQPYLREYAARPAEPYHRPQTRAADEIAFIERPRAATQAIVYADDVRREIYR